MSAGCFSPYMLICSTMQTIFGIEKRSDLERQSDINQEFQRELSAARALFQEEQKAQEYANLRAKMVVQRKYRAEEKFEQTVLQHRTEELKTFFMRSLPIGQVAIPLLLDAARNYKSLGYNAKCPINVVLLHTRQDALKYNEIFDELDKSQNDLGNLIYRRWCDKDVARNAAILNLHAIMSNIPTLVISPYFQGGSIHYTASFWEAQSEAKPMIRPLFSIKCPSEYIAPKRKFTTEGRNAIQNQMTLISTIISGCARDSYMLMSQGLPPTLPHYLKNNPEITKSLLLPENKEICSFMLNEYKTMQNILETSECTSCMITKKEMGILANFAKEANNELKNLTHKALKA